MAFVTVSSCRHSFLAWPPGRAAVTNGYTHGMCCDGCQCVPVRVCQCVRRTVLLGPGRPGPAACDSSHWQSCRVAESESVAVAAVGADAAVPARTVTAGEIYCCCPYILIFRFRSAAAPPRGTQALVEAWARNIGFSFFQDFPSSAEPALCAEAPLQSESWTIPS